MRNKKILSILLVLAMSFSLLAANVFASVTAYVRIEGDTDTFVPRTAVEVEDFDLSQYDAQKAKKNKNDIVVLQAIIKALEESGLDATDEDVIEHSGGSYISSVCGLAAGYVSGWMYTLNGVAPAYAVNNQAIKDGDEIVLYFIEDWMASSYSYFTEEQKQVKSGESVQLTLKYDELDMYTWENQTKACANANILVDGKFVGTTDAQGKITITPTEEGMHYVSANKFNEDGTNVISRPYCEINVTK